MALGFVQLSIYHLYHVEKESLVVYKPPGVRKIYDMIFFVAILHTPICFYFLIVVTTHGLRLWFLFPDLMFPPRGTFCYISTSLWN